MRESLRHEHQNHEQQNFVRVAENLELTDELNILRKKNAVLQAEVTRFEADTKVNSHNHTSAVGGQEAGHAVRKRERFCLVRFGTCSMMGRIAQFRFSTLLGTLKARGIVSRDREKDGRYHGQPLNSLGSSCGWLSDR